MRKPKWLRVTATVKISVKVSTVLSMSPHWIGTFLLVYYLLTHGQGVLPVH
jgi:hypothetical protein